MNRGSSTCSGFILVPDSGLSCSHEPLARLANALAYEVLIGILFADPPPGYRLVTAKETVERIQRGSNQARLLRGGKLKSRVGIFQSTEQPSS